MEILASRVSIYPEIARCAILRCQSTFPSNLSILETGEAHGNLKCRRPSDKSPPLVENTILASENRQQFLHLPRLDFSVSWSLIFVCKTKYKICFNICLISFQRNQESLWVNIHTWNDKYFQIKLSVKIFKRKKVKVWQVCYPRH